MFVDCAKKMEDEPDHIDDYLIMHATAATNYQNENCPGDCIFGPKLSSVL